MPAMIALSALLTLAACASPPRVNCEAQMRLCMTTPGATQIDCNERIDECKAKNDALAGRGA